MEADLISQIQPVALFDLDTGSHQHGAAIGFHEDLFVVSIGTPDASLGGLNYSTLPRGVVTFNAAGEEQQDFRGRCPQLHGSAITGAFVAFGCNEGPRNMENPNYTGPPITARSSVLVLTHDGGSPGAFTAAEVTYPEDGSTPRRERCAAARALLRASSSRVMARHNFSKLSAHRCKTARPTAVL